MNVYTQNLNGERISETLEQVYASTRQTAELPEQNPEEPYWVHEVKEDQTTLDGYFQ